MKIIIHAGTHKTGSTSIQNVCFSNKEKLLDYGIYYPLPNQNLTGHHNLANLLAKENFVIADQLMNTFLKEAFNLNCSVILLSSEEFEFLWGERKIEFFKQYGDVEVIFFFRRQDDLIEKEYEQIVKMPNVRYDGSVYNFYLDKWFQGRINYEHMIKKWCEHYIVNIYSYDLLSNRNNLINFFFEKVGINDLSNFDLSLSKSNVSLPTVSSIYLSRFNKYEKLTEKEHLSAIDYLKDFFDYQKSILIPIETRKIIISKFSDFNKKLLSNDIGYYDELYGFKRYENYKYIDYQDDFDIDIYKDILSKIRG